jgi:hypothetical protein
MSVYRAKIFDSLVVVFDDYVAQVMAVSKNSLY